MTDIYEPEKYQKFYKIVLTFESGAKVNSIVFKGYPPIEAINAGIELFRPAKWKVEELEDYDEN